MKRGAKREFEKRGVDPKLAKKKLTQCSEKLTVRSPWPKG